MLIMCIAFIDTCTGGMLHMPKRTKRSIVVAHCLLDVNTKVHGLATYPAVHPHVLALLDDPAVGLIQLPCPEATYLGMRRWGMTNEQYDTPAYREHCRRILGPTMLTLEALVADGCAIEAVIGVDGSPSCGVRESCTGYSGGEIERLLATGAVPTAQRSPGPGVFMEVFSSLLEQAGIAPVFRGVDETP